MKTGNDDWEISNPMAFPIASMFSQNYFQLIIFLDQRSIDKWVGLSILIDSR
jgi:hypothetical protein